VNPNLSTNLAGIVGKTLWIEQLKAIGVTLALAVVGTAVLGAIVKAVIGFRPSVEGEEEGLDQIDHGEAGYHLDEGLGHAVEEKGPGGVAATSLAAAPSEGGGS
jgi:Amt family ammonium transporter